MPVLSVQGPGSPSTLAVLWTHLSSDSKATGLRGVSESCPVIGSQPELKSTVFQTVHHRVST